MRLRKVIGFVVLVLLASFNPALAQERFGGIAGVVSDASPAPVPGATVTVLNETTGATRTAVSGADGSYRIPDLEPGRYTVSVELSGFQKVQADNVLILLGRTLEFPATLRVGGCVSETVDVTGEAARQIDLTSVTVQHNITEEEIERLPKTRSFQGLALASPGVNQGVIEGGIQVNGASGAENSFTVDGVVTNSLVNGASRQDTVFEYLQEVQVKTGGVDAEYGGALGGVISAVTKSGGNTYRGEAHYFLGGSPLSSGPVNRIVLNPSNETTVAYIQDDKQKNVRNEVGGSIGGPIFRDRLFFFGSYSPGFTNRTQNYNFSSGTQPGSIDSDSTVQQAFGKLTYSNNKVHANVSMLFTPTTLTGVLAAYDGNGPQFLSSSLAANESRKTRGWEYDQRNFSGNLDFWLSSQSFVTVKGGYFYDSFNDTGVPTTTSVTWNNSSIGVPGVPANLQQPANFLNTPRVQINEFDTTKQGFIQADYNHTVSKGGVHLFKGGLGYRHVGNDVVSAYPGGYVLLNWNTSLPATANQVGGRGTYGYYEVNDLGTTGEVSANMWTLYFQDTWQVNNRLTFNLGIRTEDEKIPGFRDLSSDQDFAFKFSMMDKLAPRLGASYDLTGDGRAKLYGSWGRYFDWTKYELSRGSFGGDIWYVYYRSLDTLDVFNLNLSNMPGNDLWRPTTPNSRRDRRAPSTQNVDPDIKPMYQDALNVGLEYQLNPTTVFGAHFVHNDLKETIEDLGAIVDGDEIYVIGNPGSGLGAITPVTGRTHEFATPKAMRQYDALELTMSRRFSQNWFASASYTLSRLYGNYAGLASSDEIRTPTTNTSSAVSQQSGGSVSRQGGNANRAWDLDELMFDSHGNLDFLGRLATDRPHVVKLYGAYSFSFGTQVGAFLYAGSGTPISTYVVTANQIPVFVEGRGDMGRTPMLSSTNLLVSHEFAMMGTKKLRFELNVLNLFNQQTATHIFNYLNRGAGLARGSAAINLSGTDLAQGYDYNALIRATPEGQGAYDPRYGMEDLFQDGTRGQFMVKFLF